MWSNSSLENHRSGVKNHKTATLPTGAAVSEILPGRLEWCSVLLLPGILHLGIGMTLWLLSGLEWAEGLYCSRSSSVGKMGKLLFLDYEYFFRAWRWARAFSFWYLEKISLMQNMKIFTFFINFLLIFNSTNF